MKNICKKTLAVSIILLLVGVSVSSAISIDTESPVVNQQSVEDCNCKEVDSRHLVRLERQLNRLEVYSRLLLVLSRYNPELREISEELSNEIITLKEELADDPPFPFICDILWTIIATIDGIIGFFYEQWTSSEIYSIEFYIWLLLYTTGGTMFLPIVIPILLIGAVFYCWEWESYPSL